MHISAIYIWATNFLCAFDSVQKLSASSARQHPLLATEATVATTEFRASFVWQAVGASWANLLFGLLFAAGMQCTRVARENALNSNKFLYLFLFYRYLFIFFMLTKFSAFFNKLDFIIITVQQLRTFSWLQRRHWFSIICISFPVHMCVSVIIICTYTYTHIYIYCLVRVITLFDRIFIFMTAFMSTLRPITENCACYLVLVSCVHPICPASVTYSTHIHTRTYVLYINVQLRWLCFKPCLLLQPNFSFSIFASLQYWIL